VAYIDSEYPGQLDTTNYLYRYISRGSGELHKDNKTGAQDRESSSVIKFEKRSDQNSKN